MVYLMKSNLFNSDQIYRKNVLTSTILNKYTHMFDGVSNESSFML
jgi:hypothetical protein